jgi:hypothetical protein
MPSNRPSLSTSPHSHPYCMSPIQQFSMSQPAGRPEDLEGGIRGVSSDSRALSSPV